MLDGYEFCGQIKQCWLRHRKWLHCLIYWPVSLQRLGHSASNFSHPLPVNFGSLRKSGVDQVVSFDDHYPCKQVLTEKQHWHCAWGRFSKLTYLLSAVESEGIFILSFSPLTVTQQIISKQPRGKFNEYQCPLLAGMELRALFCLSYLSGIRECDNAF